MVRIVWEVCLLVALCCNVLGQVAPPSKPWQKLQKADRVTKLPGLQSDPPFAQYSGYLTGRAEKQLHYWFVESQNDPRKDPLVLWLNGGPGCSSLDGFMTANGPYRVSEDGNTVSYNEFSWNRIANMLYLESPAGVGFSYAEDGNLTATDDTTADDNYLAIVNFFERFPQYWGREFYVTGESYAGVYLPTLMMRLKEDSRMNLVGSAIGNGMIHAFAMFESKLYYWYYHGYIGNTAWIELTNACCNETKCQFIPFRSPECQQAAGKVALSVMNIPLNQYNVNADCMVPPDDTEAQRKTRSSILLNMALNQMMAPFDDKEILREFSTLSEKLNRYLPCTDNSRLERYLNRPEVRQAIHIPAHVQLWIGCSSIVDSGPDGTYKATYSDMRPLFQSILDTKKIRLLLYYGDLDFVCDFWGGQNVIDSMQVEEVHPHRPWYYTHDDYRQIGGFARQFQNLTYLTIKGAGHMVPTDKPGVSFEMFRRFLKDMEF